MADESKQRPKKATFVEQKQQNKGYLSLSSFDPQPDFVDTVNELIYKCVGQGFKILSSIFNEIDIFEIETESSFHLGVNVSEKTIKSWKVLTFTKIPNLKKQNTQISIS